MNEVTFEAAQTALTKLAQAESSLEEEDIFQIGLQRDLREMTSGALIANSISALTKLLSEIEHDRDRLIDRWLINGGSQRQLVELTRISRPTLAKRKAILEQASG